VVQSALDLFAGTIETIEETSAANDSAPARGDARRRPGPTARVEEP
jgi:hypothetical protein